MGNGWRASLSLQLRTYLQTVDISTLKTTQHFVTLHKAKTLVQSSLILQTLCDFLCVFAPLRLYFLYKPYCKQVRLRTSRSAETSHHGSPTENRHCKTLHRRCTILHKHRTNLHRHCTNLHGRCTKLHSLFFEELLLAECRCSGGPSATLGMTVLLNTHWHKIYTL